MMRPLLAGLALATLALGGPAHAQSGAGGGDSGFSARSGGAGPYLTAEESAAFSKQVERDLAAKGARLAIVFRTGRPRDTLPDGISYTHGAFWAYVPITLDDGRQVGGYAVYNLYHGDGEALDKDKSYLHQDFPLDFVSATAVDDVAVLIPSPEMQRRMLAIMAGPTYQALHRPDYSLVSHPHDAKYQNCNEFMLDVLASAAWETADYDQIKLNLRAHFTPTRVKTSLLERLFGPMADSRLKTGDQSGGIKTVTYESMAKFMADNALLQEAYILPRATE